MKRTLRTAAVAGLVAASLGLPASAAQAATCVGIMRNPGGPNETGVWSCSPCPETIYGPLDGRFQVVLCFV